MLSAPVLCPPRQWLIDRLRHESLRSTGRSVALWNLRLYCVDSRRIQSNPFLLEFHSWSPDDRCVHLNVFRFRCSSAFPISSPSQIHGHCPPRSNMLTGDWQHSSQSDPTGKTARSNKEEILLSVEINCESLPEYRIFSRRCDEVEHWHIQSDQTNHAEETQDRINQSL